MHGSMTGTLDPVMPQSSFVQSFATGVADRAVPRPPLLPKLLQVVVDVFVHQLAPFFAG